MVTWPGTDHSGLDLPHYEQYCDGQSGTPRESASQGITAAGGPLFAPGDLNFNVLDALLRRLPVTT